MSDDHLPIVIVGAGLGGLMAARVLHVHGIRATVLDLDEGPEARAQGGMLDIHDDSGQRAMRAAGLFEQFRQLVHPGGEAMRILDRSGSVLREEGDDGDLSRPEVDRGRLRALLICSLPEGCIRWGTKVLDVNPLQGGRHLLTLAGGDSITADLLIGADGAWSRVRSLVTDSRPVYTGVSFVEADLFDADARHPVEAEAVGAGMLFALDGQTGILAHRESDGSLHVYLGHRAVEGWLDSIDFTDRGAATSAVLGLLPGWSPALRGLIDHADTPLVPRRIHALPVGISWPRTPGVTLLGDAAHLMSPFAGEGANLALFDAAELAVAIASRPGAIEEALRDYEQALFTRAGAAAGESAQNLDVIFSDDSPRGLLEQFAQYDTAAAAQAAAATGPWKQ